MYVCPCGNNQKQSINRAERAVWERTICTKEEPRGSVCEMSEGERGVLEEAGDEEYRRK